jgi:hypothetical protein
VKTHTKVFTTAKEGNLEAENQDSFAHPADEHGYCSEDCQRFAVADGATEAIFSGLWASLLTKAWSSAELSLDSSRYEDTLASLSAQWLANVATASMPWWAEEKLRRGAFSTLAGLRITQDETNRTTWSLSAVGDSCLFLIRANQVVVKGPLTHSDQFGFSPYLIGSPRSQHESIRANLVHLEGELDPGDELVLATDALSCWFMRKLEQGYKPSELLLFLEHENADLAFTNFVNNARSSQQMRNDDVTFMSIAVL